MITHWIGGEARPSSSHEAIEVSDPADCSVIATIPRGTTADAELAVEAAGSARREWWSLGPEERRRRLVAAARRITECREPLADLLVAENGKPRRHALAEVDTVATAMQSYAELAIHFRSAMQSAARGRMTFQHRVPRGVVASIVPWNYPLSLGFEKAAAALAAGNTVVMKPSEKTPLTTRRIAEEWSGLLGAGVLNVLLGDGQGVGAPLVEHDSVDAVTFVGSEPVGRWVAEVCGRRLRPAVLELGGNDAFIIAADADLDRAVDLAVDAKFTNAGQICNATERFLVDQRVADEFSARLTARAAALRVGAGSDPTTDMGPLIDREHREKVDGQVAEARANGARLLTGGHALDGPGAFYAPTVMTDVPSETALYREETFGPVAVVERVADFDEAVRRANATRFGLAAVVCTSSAARALQAIEELEVGTVRINARRGRTAGSSSEPMKASGYGHGAGVELLEELSVERAVHWDTMPASSGS